MDNLDNLEDLLKLDDMEALFEGNSLAQGNDDLNKSVEEQIASMKSELEAMDKSIADLKESLETDEYYKTSAGAADYEVNRGALEGMEDAAEEMRKELNELITNALEKGEIKGDVESFLKNPYREENFKIDRVGIDGHYAVFSDSERFGKQAIVYENTDRNKCVDYIEQRQPAKEPTYYVIENLHDFAQGLNQNIIYSKFETCLQLYQEYSALEECQAQYNKICGIQKDISDGKTTVVLGVTTGGNDQDIIRNYQDSQVYPIFNEFFVKGEHATNKYILDDLQVIKTQIENIQGKEIFVNTAMKDDYFFEGYSNGNERQRKETIDMISVLENAEKECAIVEEEYWNGDLDSDYAKVMLEKQKVEELAGICADKLVNAVEKDVSRSEELTLAGARKLLEPEFRDKLKTALNNDKDVVSINAVYINRHQVQCTGYQNRPEITQKLLDKMIYQRDESILKYEILDDKKEKEILKEIVENKDRKKALMYMEAKAKEESTMEEYIQIGSGPDTLDPDTIEAYLQSRRLELVDMEKFMDFHNCYFSGIKLEGTFEGVNFSDCYFSNCKFENAEFKECNFKNATFSDVEARSVSFQNTGFEGADLWSSRFENTQFKEVNFSESNWKSISTVTDTVSFENCNFTMTSMNAVYIQGSKISGEMKNIDTISVTLGGATSQEIENHKRMIKDTLGSNNARGKEIGKKEHLGTEGNRKKKSDRASATMSSRKPEARRRRGKSR
ncbi:MAG: pentapeptide repeat-containing protein [Lachnospiraceae bacterium]|nr:pentapeptide repeat-containing protein [Lachnospiraceae bacterium]